MSDKFVQGQRIHQVTNTSKSASSSVPGYKVVPSTCGEGYHVTKDGKVIRDGRLPRRFPTLEAAEQYILQQGSIASPDAMPEK